MNWKSNALLLLGLILSIITITILPSILIELWYFAIGLLIVIGLSVIWLAFTWALMVREKMLMVKAQRKQAEYQIHTDGLGQSFIIRDGQIVSLTTNPRTHINGHYEPATNEEIALQMAFYNAIAKSKAAQIEVPASEITIEQKPDLLTLIDQYPHVLVYGGTGGGKTSLLRTLAHKRKLAGHDVVILDSHEHPAKWHGLVRMETPVKIDKAIGVLFKILQENIIALRTGQKTEEQFRKITVITDEWTEIVSDNDTAKEFIATMVRQSRKYGISLVFATQTNLAIDLGLDGRYKTINGFLQLKLSKSPDGKYMAFAHTSTEKLGEFEVPLPPIVPQLQLPPVIPNETLVPTDEEQQILDMLANGDSYRTITQTIWQQRGSFYNGKIEAIAKKYRREVRE